MQKPLKLNLLENFQFSLPTQTKYLFLVYGYTTVVTLQLNVKKLTKKTRLSHDSKNWEKKSLRVGKIGAKD